MMSGLQAPQTQALSSTTFRPPPLDGSLNLPELYDWHLQHSPEHSFFVYALEDGKIRKIKWSDMAQAMHRGSKIVSDRMRTRSAPPRSAVAILASSGESGP